MNATHTRKAPQPGATASRQILIKREAIDEESRTVTLAFASETPVDRGFYSEVLSLAPNAVRLQRIRQGGALLLNHDTGDQIGVVESVRIDTDRVGRAVVRFGKGAKAEEIFADVVDGIRRNVSVGYMIHAAKLTESGDNGDVYTVTDWEPFEISLVSVPADTSVGVGRSHYANSPEDNRMSEHTTAAHEGDNQNTATQTRSAPAPAPATPAQPVDVEAIRARARKDESHRSAEIMAIGQTFADQGVREMADAAVRNGMPLGDFRTQVMEHLGKKPTPSANIGLTESETREYSVVRALHALANPTDMHAREAAAFEFEASRAAADKQGRDVKGIVMPFDVMRRSIAQGLATRASDDVVGTASKGGDLVATDLLSGSFIDMLRNAMVIRRLGARYLTGLVGNVAIPKQTGGADFYWLAEDGTVTNSGQTVGQVSMKPHTGAAKTQISRKLLVQSSIDVESFVRQDIANSVGLGIQAAAINGIGASNEPTGILNITGIGSVKGGTNGGAPDWNDVIDLETAVAAANADVGTLGYLTNSKVRGKLKKTFENGSGSDRVWQAGAQPLNGYAAAVTNAVPSNGTKGTGTDLSSLIFGNFADLIIGMWGGLELQVDPYSSGDSGAVIVRAFQDVDVGVRHAESFAAMTDAITA